MHLDLFLKWLIWRWIVSFSNSKCGKTWSCGHIVRSTATAALRVCNCFKFYVFQHLCSGQKGIFHCKNYTYYAWCPILNSSKFRKCGHMSCQGCHELRHENLFIYFARQLLPPICRKTLSDSSEGNINHLESIPTTAHRVRYGPVQCWLALGELLFTIMFHLDSIRFKKDWQTRASRTHNDTLMAPFTGAQDSFGGSL